MLCICAKHISQQLCMNLETVLSVINTGLRSAVLILKQELEVTWDEASSLEEGVGEAWNLVMRFQKTWASDFARQDGLDSQHRSMLALATQVAAAAAGPGEPKPPPGP